MTLDTIQDLLARRPFDSGDRYEVRHPEIVLRVKNGLYVGLGGRGNVAERAAFVSLLHVASIETGPRANGAGKRR